MTWKQQKKAREEVRGLMFKDMTKRQYILFHELQCRSMIDSCLIYGSNFFDRYDSDFIKELGIRKVKKLYKEQLEDFNKSQVFHSVYEDSEWGTYNSIKWRDEY